jgi:hypothetical protein
LFGAVTLVQASPLVHGQQFFLLLFYDKAVVSAHKAALSSWPPLALRHAVLVVFGALSDQIGARAVSWWWAILL